MWKDSKNKNILATYGPFKLTNDLKLYGPGIPVPRPMFARDLEEAKKKAELIVRPRLKRYEINKIRNSKISGKGTRLYRIWEGIISRTENPKDKDYHHYGARGIKVCKQWRNSFKAFESWAKQNEYKSNLTIDRRNNDGDYHPSNCRFITIKEQANNRRSNLNVKYKGKVKPLKKWCEELGLAYHTMYYRIVRSNWTVKKAFETPSERENS